MRVSEEERSVREIRRQWTRGPAVVAYLKKKRAVDASVPADSSERAVNAMIGSHSETQIIGFAYR